MKTLRFALIAVALLVPAIIGAAQNTAVDEAGTIQGTITRASNGEPLSGAAVTLQGANVDPQAMQVLLNTAASQGIVVTPAPGATTSDIVQSLANAAQARGFPLSVANIQSQLASLSGRTPPTTTTDRDGRFTFANVAPGPYTIRAQKDGFFGKPEGGMHQPTAAVDVIVAGRETKDASLSMTPGAIVGGRIFDANGQLMSNANVQAFMVLGSGAGTVNGVVQDGPLKVVPGATVVLVPEAKRRSNRALYAVAGSDASGRFNLRGVAPGDYKIFAWESIPAFAYQNAAFIAKHEDRGKLVHVNQSGTVTTELTIIPAVEKK